MRLGERIEQLRLEREWNLNELGRRTGMHTGQLTNVEVDPFRHTSVFVIRRIARAFGITMDTLMDGVEDPPPRAARGRRSPRV